MPQLRLNPVYQCQTYQILLLGQEGETKLVYRTVCFDDDDAIDKLFAIRDVPYARFEISCEGEIISKGARFE